MLLRLKNYTRSIYERFLSWADEPTATEESTQTAKRIRASYATLGMTILFFNQEQPSKELILWVKDNPFSYKAKLIQTLSLLEDSAKWAISSLGLDESDVAAVLDRDYIEELRITEQDEEYQRDVLRQTFAQTCTLLHDTCPYNVRLLFALERLIRAYSLARATVEEAKDVSKCDRLEYLRRLTRY